MAMRTTRAALAGDMDELLDELCRRDFSSFIMRAFPHVTGGANIDFNWHLDAIAAQLDRVRRGSCRRLLVNLPPRNGKSFLVSVAWVAWMLGQDPSINFVCVSYSLELAGKLARDCRAIVQSAWYKRMFPGTVISPTRSAALDFETTRGGGRLATSIGGTLTGRGGDIIIIDDPIKPDEAMSDTTRTSVNEWFSSTLASRLNDKRRGAIITVMQRLHEYDLCGMLLDTGQWDQLSLPAIATEAVTVPLTGARFYNRPEGEVLHASRENLATLDEIKEMIGSVAFAAQYQQGPVPAGGNLVQLHWLMEYDDLPADGSGRIVQSWDTASKDGLLTDYSVCVTARIIRRKVYIIDVWRKRVLFPELRQTAIDLALHYRARVILIEDAASGQQLLQTLWNDKPRGVVTPTRRKPEGDKQTRLAAVTPMMERGELLLPKQAPWLADFKSEVLAFPSSVKDDQVDALSQLLIWAELHQHTTNTLEGGGPMLFTGDGQGGGYWTGIDTENFGKGSDLPDDYDPWVPHRPKK